MTVPEEANALNHRVGNVSLLLLGILDLLLTAASRKPWRRRASLPRSRAAPVEISWAVLK